MGNNGTPRKECQDFSVMYDRAKKNHSNIFGNSDLLRGKVRQVLFKLGASSDKESEQVHEIGAGYILVMPTKNDVLATVLVQNSCVIFHFTVVMKSSPKEVVGIMQGVFDELGDNSFKLAVVEYEKVKVESIYR